MLSINWMSICSTFFYCSNVTGSSERIQQSVNAKKGDAANKIVILDFLHSRGLNRTALALSNLSIQKCYKKNWRGGDGQEKATRCWRTDQKKCWKGIVWNKERHWGTVGWCSHFKRRGLCCKTVGMAEHKNVFCNSDLSWLSETSENFQDFSSSFCGNTDYLPNHLVPNQLFIIKRL